MAVAYTKIKVFIPYLRFRESSGLVMTASKKISIKSFIIIVRAAKGKSLCKSSLHEQGSSKKVIARL